MQVIKQNYGSIDGQTISKFTLVNDQGMTISFLDYGCTITEIIVPDRNGKFENIVLGFDNLEAYQSYSFYFGSIIGRVAGRIKGASFELDGNIYTLAKNESRNCLHSGTEGLHQVKWRGEIVNKGNDVGVKFSYLSPDGEGGFPGNLCLHVTYTLNQLNEFTILYEGVSDKRTLINLTNHTYFNLSGKLNTSVGEHWLKMASDQFVELDNEMLPTGRLLEVKGTPFDFRNWRKLKDGMNSNHQQNKLAGWGYDHPFLLNREKEIMLFEGESGRTLKITTTEPAVVLYTGNMLEGDFLISGNVKVHKYLGLCLETQALPDAVHHSHFPSITFEQGEKYQSQTMYYFGIEEGLG